MIKVHPFMIKMHACLTYITSPLATMILGTMVLDLVEHHIPNFSRLTRIAKIDLLLFGIKPNDPDYNHLNVVLTKAIQTYIVQTKRFLHK